MNEGSRAIVRWLEQKRRTDRATAAVLSVLALGVQLLAGVGQWIYLVVAGVILFEVKIHQEERLLLTVFPSEYPAYRERVPQLVPGLGLVHRTRKHAAS